MRTAEAPAEIILPGQHRHPPCGLVVRQHRLSDLDRRVHRGLALTTPVRTAYDLARRLDLVEGVVAVDALAGRFGFRPDALLEIADREPRARGLRRIVEVVPHVEPLAGSPMESRLRMLLVSAGLPRPVAQQGIPDRRSRIVAVVDLAYPAQQIAIEYEGEDHFTAERSMRDVHRYTRLVDLGWRVYRYRARDVLGNPSGWSPRSAARSWSAARREPGSVERRSALTPPRSHASHPDRQTGNHAGSTGREHA